MRKIDYLFAGLAALAVLAAGAAYFSFARTATPTVVLGSDIKIEKVGSRAFGRLVAQATNPASEQSAAAGGLASNNGADLLPPQVLNAPSGAAAKGGSIEQVPVRNIGVASPIYPAQIAYKYRGEPLTLPTSELDVLRRVKGASSAVDLIALLNRINLGLLDLASFGAAELQNYSIAENKPYGYGIFVNLLEGDISISQNWPQWPNPYEKCLNQDQACYDGLQLRPSDMPPDQDLIAIADQFLSDHRIDPSHYSEPQVQSDWKMYSEGAGVNDLRPWVPDTITVLYPLVLERKGVYDEGGMAAGLNVSVNVREKRVVGVYQLQSQSYQSSRYAVEQDTARLLRLAEQGGRWGGAYPIEKGTVVQEVSLSTPTLQWVRVWNYRANQSEELEVPAFVFPVASAPNGSYYSPKNIVVPVIKEILDSTESPPVKILPAQGAAGAGAAQ